MTLELRTNRELKLSSRPAEKPEDFEARCLKVADEHADMEIAELRDKYEAKVTKLRTQIGAAEDRAGVVESEGKGRQRDELLSTAGSVLGGLLSGRRSKGRLLGSILGKAGRAALGQSRSRTAERRIEEADNKVTRLTDELEALDAELSAEITEIDARWMETAKQITTMSVSAEKSDVEVVQICLTWLPVA
jgi:hypothetical protein